MIFFRALDPAERLLLAIGPAAFVAMEEVAARFLARAGLAFATVLATLAATAAIGVPRPLRDQRPIA